MALENSNTSFAYIRCVMDVDPFTWYVPNCFCWVILVISLESTFMIRLNNMRRVDLLVLSPFGL